MLTRKNLLIGGSCCLILIFAMVYFLYNFQAAQIPRNSQPRIVELEKFRVRILWDTGKPFQGQLWYSMEGKPEQYIKEKVKGRRHVVEISGLMPETLYNYRLSKAAREVYSFKTAPLSETAFRFMIYNQHHSFSLKNLAQFIGVVNAQLPDFIILTGKLSTKKYLTEEQDFFKSIRSATRIPIFIAPEADDLRDTESLNYFLSLLPKDNNGMDYAFDYGNSRFIILNSSLVIASDAVSKSKRAAWIHGKMRARASDSPPGHVFVVISDLAAMEKNDPESYRVLSQMSPGKKIDAVFNAGGSGQVGNLAGAKLINDSEKYLVFDVDGEGVTGTVSGHGQSGLDILTINETPEAVKRSCIYCRKLLDTRRYQESIDWYRKFIQEFGAKYMVDDAQFEIANIYDQYLFDYSTALKEYRKLIDEYPNSGKVRQVMHRIEYINAYADYNFDPLRIFEKAKSQTYQQDKKKAVAEIETILAQYPGAKLEPQVLFWLGYTLSETNLEKSVSYFRKIIAGYPGREITGEARIALGDAYYLHNKFRESIDAYTSAIKKSGNIYNFGLLDKIRKSQRDIIRVNIANIFTVILLFSYLLILLWKPRFFTSRELKLGFYLFVGYLVGGSFVWAIFFRNYQELIRMIPLLAIVAATVPMMTTAFSRKFLKTWPGLTKIMSVTLAALLLSVGVLFVFIYYYYSHYLTVFGF